MSASFLNDVFYEKQQKTLRREILNARQELQQVESHRRKVKEFLDNSNKSSPEVLTQYKNLLGVYKNELIQRKLNLKSKLDSIAVDNNNKAVAFSGNSSKVDELRYTLLWAIQDYEQIIAQLTTEILALPGDSPIGLVGKLRDQHENAKKLFPDEFFASSKQTEKVVLKPSSEPLPSFKKELSPDVLFDALSALLIIQQGFWWIWKKLISSKQ